jgi:transcriptional regulator with XRE-family HTH domain
MKSGVSQSTIASYETDVAEPTIFRLMCICEVLNVSLDWIAKGE